MDPFYKGATSFFAFSQPACRATVDYRAVFKNFLDDANTNALIESVTSTRSAMLSAMINKTQTCDQKLAVVDQYLTALYKLFESLLAQGGVKVSQALSYEWFLYISATSNETFKSADMVFEIIMLLHLKAQLYYCMGRALLEADLRSFLTEASKHFLTASSIMDFLQANLVPDRWGKKLHHSLPNPPEAQPGHCMALSLYYRTCAQVCASLKAMENASASAMVRCRVAVAVVNVSSRLVSVLVELNTPNKGFSSHVACIRELFSALAYWQLAQHSLDKTEVGAAMGCVERARGHLSEQGSGKHEALKAGLPKSNLPAGLPGSKQLVLQKVDEIYTAADRDNRFVHFQQITVPGLPAEALVMAPSAPYSQPSADVLITFKPNVKQSFISSLFGRSSSSASNTAAGAPEAKDDKDGGGGAGGGGVDATSVVSAPPPPPSPPVYQGLQPAAQPMATAPPPPSAPQPQYMYNQNNYYTVPPGQAPQAPPPGSYPTSAQSPYNPYAVDYSNSTTRADEMYAREVQAQLDRQAAGRR